MNYESEPGFSIFYKMGVISAGDLMTLCMGLAIMMVFEAGIWLSLVMTTNHLPEQNFGMSAIPGFYSARVEAVL